MEYYKALALDLMNAMTKNKKGPPHEEISATMRGEMAVLRLLDHENVPMAAGEISKTLDMTTSRIAAVLGSLEKKGMIQRQTDHSDRRRVLVTLTPQGGVFCRQRRQEALDLTAEMLSKLGEKDAADFVRIVKRIQAAMPDEPPCIHEIEKRKEESADE